MALTYRKSHVEELRVANEQCLVLPPVVALGKEVEVVYRYRQGNPLLQEKLSVTKIRLNEG